jgi:SAM-dependent methyltransferase
MYEHWAELYETSFGDMARRTWEKGILTDLREFGATGGRVLDAGAGTGIGGDLLHSRGAFDIVSVDGSPEMLARCRTPGPKIVADLTVLQLDGPAFDWIVAGFDTLNYLDGPGLRAFLAGAAAQLAESGRLVFDYSSPKLFRYDWDGRTADYPVGDLIFRWEHRCLADGSIESCLRCLSQGRELWSEIHRQFALDTFSIYQACRDAGLDVFRVRNLDSLQFSPASSTHVYHVLKLDRSETKARSFS